MSLTAIQLMTIISILEGELESNPTTSPILDELRKAHDIVSQDSRFRVSLQSVVSASDEVEKNTCHWCEMAEDPNNTSVTVCPFHKTLTVFDEE